MRPTTSGSVDMAITRPRISLGTDSDNTLKARDIPPVLILMTKAHMTANEIRSFTSAGTNHRRDVATRVTVRTRQWPTRSATNLYGRADYERRQAGYAEDDAYRSAWVVPIIKGRDGDGGVCKGQPFTGEQYKEGGK